MLYVMRHFQSEMNLQDLVCGRSDPPLTEYGYKDAQRVGKEFAKTVIDYAICSPLMRAKESLKEVLRHQKNQVPWEIDPRIIEFDFGDYEAKVIKTLTSTDTNFKKRYSRDCDSKAVNMESVDTVHIRINSFLDDITKRFKGKNLLVVSHNGAIRVMKSIIYNYPRDKDLHDEGIRNGQILAFDILK